MLGKSAPLVPRALLWVYWYF